MILNVTSPKRIKRHTNLLSEGQISGNNFFINSFIKIKKIDGFVNFSTTDLDIDIDIPTKTILLTYIGNNENFTFDGRKIVGQVFFGSETTGYIHKITDQYSGTGLKQIEFRWDAKFNDVNATGYEFTVAKFQALQDTVFDLICVTSSRIKITGNSSSTVSTTNISGDGHDISVIDYTNNQSISSRVVSGPYTSDPTVYWGWLECSAVETFNENLFTASSNGFYAKNFLLKGVPIVPLQWDFDSSQDRTESYGMVCGVKRRVDVQPADVQLFIIKHISSKNINNLTYSLGNQLDQMEESEFLSTNCKRGEIPVSGQDAPTSPNSSLALGSDHFSVIFSFDENSILARKNFYAVNRFTTLENNCNITFVSQINIVDFISTVPTLDVDECLYQISQKQADTSLISTSFSALALDEADTSGTTMRLRTNVFGVPDIGNYTGVEGWFVDLTVVAFKKASNVKFCEKFKKENNCPFFFHKLKSGGARIWALIELFNTVLKTDKIKIKDIYNKFVKNDGNYILLKSMYDEFTKDVLRPMQKLGIHLLELDESVEIEEKLDESIEIQQPKILNNKIKNIKIINKKENRKIINNRLKHLIKDWRITELNMEAK